MKKCLLGMLAILSVFVFTGCDKLPNKKEKMTSVQTEIETVVVACEKGEFYLDPVYLSMANNYLVQQNISMYNNYMLLAESNGYYDYKITVTIDEVDYTVTRDHEFEIGESITVTKVDKYRNSEYINTEYK